MQILTSLLHNMGMPNKTKTAGIIASLDEKLKKKKVKPGEQSAGARKFRSVYSGGKAISTNLMADIANLFSNKKYRPSDFDLAK